MVVVITCVISTFACGLPRDADDTLAHLRGDTMRVGVSHNPPWTVIATGDTSGVEPQLARDIAHTLGATIHWSAGAESVLLEALRERELHLVLGGLTDDTPWKHEIALSRPYHVDPHTGKKHVLAAPPGENAWLLHIDRELQRRRDGIATPEDSAS